jgi:hypothetical protein
VIGCDEEPIGRQPTTAVKESQILERIAGARVLSSIPIKPIHLTLGLGTFVHNTIFCGTP